MNSSAPRREIIPTEDETRAAAWTRIEEAATLTLRRHPKL
jgi:hypothetical protein